MSQKSVRFLQNVFPRPVPNRSAEPRHRADLSGCLRGGVSRQLIAVATKIEANRPRHWHPMLRRTPATRRKICLLAIDLADWGWSPILPLKFSRSHGLHRKVAWMTLATWLFLEPPIRLDSRSPWLFAACGIPPTATITAGWRGGSATVAFDEFSRATTPHDGTRVLYLTDSRDRALTANVSTLTQIPLNRFPPVEAIVPPRFCRQVLIFRLCWLILVGHLLSGRSCRS
jgi:hypothetical protein